MITDKIVMFIEIAILSLMLASVSTSVNQLETSESHCVGHPCMTNSECGSSCFCANGMCYSALKE